jgi:hypothetical protein
MELETIPLGMAQSSQEKGPNGFPYADNDRTRVSRFENGDYHIKLVRSDGERVDVNLRPGQMSALKKSIELAETGGE